MQKHTYAMKHHTHCNASVPLLWMLLMLLSACGCFASREESPTFDGLPRGKARSGSVSVVHELPVQGQGAWQTYTVAAVEENWAPIRIHASAEDLKDTSKYLCTQESQMRRTFSKSEVQVSCEAEDVVTSEKNKLLVDTMIPKAIKLHTDRLQVRSVKGNLKIAPFYSTQTCSKFTVPPTHHTEGVPNADFVLYVAAAPGPIFSDTCSRDTAAARVFGLWGRPISGGLNFRPSLITGMRYHVRIAAHEIAHALGFTRGAMGHSSANIVKYEMKRRNTEESFSVISKKTVEAAQQHYSCKTLKAMPLEVTQANRLHWSRRVAKDELMSPYVDVSSGAYYTALTMSVFHDLGYYRANFSMAETMSWGKGSGCPFVQGKCIENNVTEYPSMFCTATSEALRCTSDRYALGSCVMEKYPILPEQYTYFGNLRLGGPESSKMKHCPIITPTYDTLCADGDVEGMPGSVVGAKSRCLTGDGIVLKNPVEGSRPVGDVCANVKCENGAVHVRYKGAAEWLVCRDGSALDLAKSSRFSSGRIICPRYEEMCTDLSNIDINDSEEGEDEDDDDDYEEDDNGNDDHKNADTEQKSKKNGAKKEGKKNGAKQKGKKDGLQQESTLKEVIEKVEGSVSSDNEAEKAQVKESDGGFSEPRLWSALVLFAAAASVLLVP